ncbi:MAG: leucyl aminopeptidase [Salinivirgaceae bacterium]|nr:leucyl aminopeptidase [Salinivirgaceae bacterium]MDD4747188.1 leucyl aminopeptidase [Salinivirgaceae bacterium]MDY0280650.1 leucyl aminopeptidase [Salinivirgaceae bacterium]
MIDLIFNLRNDRPQLVNSAFLIENIDQLQSGIFSDREIDYIQHQIENNKKFISLNYYYHWNYIIVTPTNSCKNDRLEELRKIGAIVAVHIKKHEVNFVNVVDNLNDYQLPLAFIEGLALASYSFKKYKTEKPKGQKFGRINLFSQNITQKNLEHLESVITAVYKTRDLVNEPASYLTAEKLADEAVQIAKNATIEVEVFHKEKLQKIKMGGLLAVNQGSTEPPTLTKMEWKPTNALNEKPIVLIGKGVVYDSGGLSLKPTENSMDEMKCDMAGAAAVINTMDLLANTQAPYHVIALIPATDNRLSANSYAPGDVVTMYDGQTVEVMNTDAEGRMILADALSYAKQFDPELTITVATLTGSAVRAIGERASVFMGNAPQETMLKLVESANRTHERTVQFPFWDDYAEELKSDVADMKNIGSNLGGSITAGKFLEKFAPKNFIHIDIAGTAFYTKEREYYPIGGTGYGVRLLVDFINNYNNKKTIAE